MKCPIREVSVYDEERVHHWEPADCLKEECAWWDRTAEKCVVLQLAFELDDVHCQLTEVAKELTLIRPPAK